MSQVEYLGDENILFLDISSTCTGWAVGSMKLNTHEATIHRAGAIWFDKDTPHGARYHYLQEFILNVIYTRYGIANIVAEGYMVNLKRAFGTLVIPEATGAIKAACHEVYPHPLGFYTILPQSWRAALKIKKDTKLAGTKAWKEPTKIRVEELLKTTIPAKMVSNVTGKPRATPYDLTDALAIAAAWFMKEPNRCKKVYLKEGAIK